MAKFIVFGNQKGGIGKTTLTILTATGLSQAPFNKKILSGFFLKKNYCNLYFSILFAC